MRVRRRKEFTLIELLVVIGIIAILAAILLPSLVVVKKKSKQIQCTGNCHQISLAISNYVDEYDGTIPYVADALYAPGVTIHYWSENFQNYIKSWKVLVCPSLDKETDASATHPRCDYGRNYSHISTRPPAPMTKLRCIRRPAQVLAFVDAKRNHAYHDDSWLVYCPCCPTITGTQMQNVDARHNGFANIAYWDGHVGQLRWKTIQGGGDVGILWYHAP